MELSRFRKLISLAVTAAIVYALQLVGLGEGDMARIGFGLTDVSGPIVDYLITIGIPAVVMAAQPDGDDPRSLLSQWRWWLGGFALIAAAIAVAVVL